MVWDDTRMAEFINHRNRLFFLRLLESAKGDNAATEGLMIPLSPEQSPELRWLEECDVRHPTNKHERMMVNEKKKKEKQSRKRETENVSDLGEDNIHR